MFQLIIFLCSKQIAKKGIALKNQVLLTIHLD